MIEVAEYTKHAVRKLNLKTSTKEIHWTDNVFFKCPYHLDKTPSLSISFTKGIYKCFGCSRTGHITELYGDLTGGSLYEDMGYSSDDFSVFSYTPPAEEPDYTKPTREVTIEISGEVIPAAESREAIRYLRKRGIPLEIAQSMQMSYMDNGYINGIPYVKRLVIPIYESGKLLSVEGRDVTGTQLKKVLYPKDTTIGTLFDLEKLDKQKELYVVEGLLDLAVLRADSYFKNSTTIFGASLSRRQVFLLNQFNKVIYIPDNDQAGRATVGKLKDNLEKPFYILEVPRLDNIKDIGDIPTKLHTDVISMRKRGWGGALKTSLSLIFY